MWRIWNRTERDTSGKQETQAGFEDDEDGLAWNFGDVVAAYYGVLIYRLYFGDLVGHLDLFSFKLGLLLKVFWFNGLSEFEWILHKRVYPPPTPTTTPPP